MERKKEREGAVNFTVERLESWLRHSALWKCQLWNVQIAVRLLVWKAGLRWNPKCYFFIIIISRAAIKCCFLLGGQRISKWPLNIKCFHSKWQTWDLIKLPTERKSSGASRMGRGARPVQIVSNVHRLIFSTWIWKTERKKWINSNNFGWIHKFVIRHWHFTSFYTQAIVSQFIFLHLRELWKEVVMKKLKSNV